MLQYLDTAPENNWEFSPEHLTSPLAILLAIVWIIALVGVSTIISSGNVGNLPSGNNSNSSNQESKKKGSSHAIGRVVNRSSTHNKPSGEKFESVTNIRKFKFGNACKGFIGRLPQRVFNFYIDTFIIPTYRPEWGKYQTWSFKCPLKDTNSKFYQERERQKAEQRLVKKNEILTIMSPRPITHDHNGCTRVKFNVNGRIFETQTRTLARFPDSLLGDPDRRQQYYDPDSESYFFDRNPGSFEAILYFYQSGGYLRRPENIHLDIFYDDAVFYGLPQDVLSNFQLEEGIGGDAMEEDHMPKNLLQRKIWLLFDYPESSHQARILALSSVFVIVLSISIFCIETIPDFGGTSAKRLGNGEISEKQFNSLDIADPIFFTETICSIWFTVELLARFLACPNKIAFIKSLQNIIDFVSVVPYFITLVTIDGTDKSKGGTASLSILRIVRLVRVFRIFKLSRHSKGLKILGLTLKASMSELFLLIFFVLLGIILFSSMLYFAEQDEPESEFRSIPSGFWFVVTTMTTVGYGETVPKTVGGKIVGSLCAITGVLTIALPVPVIVSNFNYFYHQSIDEQDFTFTKIHHVANCPFRPCGDSDQGELPYAIIAIKEEGSKEENIKVVVENIED